MGHSAYGRRRPGPAGSPPVRESAYALGSMPNHLTPEQIAAEHEISREDVLRFCIEHDVPVFHGQIDRTLFAAEWMAAQGSADEPDQA